MNDSQRIEWLAGMHTLHRKVVFLYAVTGYYLNITHDDYDLAEFYADENDHGGMEGAWRAVIDMAAERWHRGRELVDVQSKVKALGVET